MRPLVNTILASLLAILTLAAKPEPRLSFSELVGRAHLSGCSLLEHKPGSKHLCLTFRAELRAALEATRRHAFREAVDLARELMDRKALIETLERRAAE